MSNFEEKKYSGIEVIEQLPKARPAIRAALFDFDGTISTLRYGWEEIMEPMMLEMIANGKPVTDEQVNEVREYIDQSTGIQTIFQMQWLAETVKEYGNNLNASDDPWWYKREYNIRLMELVIKRIEAIKSKKKENTEFIMKGSLEFLRALREKGIEIYAASGTDHPDVVNESRVIGANQYFTEIKGAPVDRADCSKEAVLRDLINDKKLKGNEVVVFGDGKVEIALAREVGAIAIGIASDEQKREGINPVKRNRLVKAGAYAVIGDFDNRSEIFDFLDIK